MEYKLLKLVKKNSKLIIEVSKLKSISKDDSGKSFITGIDENGKFHSFSSNSVNQINRGRKNYKSILYILSTIDKENLNKKKIIKLVEKLRRTAK